MRARWILWAAACAASICAAERDEGYRGIWYFNEPLKNQYVYKYSGGFATYPQQHAPIAIYSEKARKTFFVYGGTQKGLHNRLLHMVSYYDHATGRVPRPVILLDKETDDAHDNPVLSIGGDGYLWVFSPAHGTSRPSYLSRSVKPYSIDEFERVWTTNFSYPQPWYLPGRGFLFLHTRYGQAPGSRSSGRMLHWMTSRDGLNWEDPRRLAFIEMGDYQISWPDGERVGTAFDFHPSPVGLNERTNLYYAETRDFGRSWLSVDRRELALPLTESKNPALVRDYRGEKSLVYLKDLQYDAGNPVILYLTSRSFRPGPDGGPHVFHTARWTGGKWEFRRAFEADHNYDHGSLYVERGVWRVIAPTGAGPQAYATGGEIEMWESRDQGATWLKTREMTRGSARNHTYVRRPLNAHPDFYALWADGDAFKPSESRIYFANRKGEVFVLPAEMKREFEKPVRVK
jgi:hypothetical protein